MSEAITFRMKMRGPWKTRLSGEPLRVRAPSWVRNDPAADWDPWTKRPAKRCLSCRGLVKRPGLCAACFLDFWSRRLQAQRGRWLRRDIPKVFYAPFIDNAWGAWEDSE